MLEIGLDVPRSGAAHDLTDAQHVGALIGNFPLIIRPAYTLGDAGGGIAYNREEFEEIVLGRLDQSPVKEMLIQKSLMGWKEFGLERMRDTDDNCVVIW